MLSIKIIFLIGVASGFLAIAMWAVIIFAPFNDLLKLFILVIGCIVCVGLPQAYIHGKVGIPLLGKVIIPDHLNTSIKQYKKFGVFVWGAFSPVIVSVLGYILWLKI